MTSSNAKKPRRGPAAGVAGSPAPPPGGQAAGRKARQGIPRADRSQPLPLSFAQQRLWFLDQLRPGDSRYNSAVALRLTGTLDRAALSRALDAAPARHESLRTTFDDVDGRPVQTVHPAAPVPLPVHDLGQDRPRTRRGGGPDRHGALDDLLLAEYSRPFDLRTGPAAAGPAGTAGRRRAHPAAHRAPHRHRRLVHGRAAGRTVHALRRPGPRRRRPRPPRRPRSTRTSPYGSANGCPAPCWRSSSPTGPSSWTGPCRLALPLDRPRGGAQRRRRRGPRVPRPGGHGGPAAGGGGTSSTPPCSPR